MPTIPVPGTKRCGPCASWRTWEALTGANEISKDLLGLRGLRCFIAWDVPSTTSAPGTRRCRPCANWRPGEDIQSAWNPSEQSARDKGHDLHGHLPKIIWTICSEQYVQCALMLPGQWARDDVPVRIWMESEGSYKILFWAQTRYSSRGCSVSGGRNVQSAHGYTKVSISQTSETKKRSNGTETLCETSHNCILFETTGWVLKTGVNLADDKTLAQKLR